MRFIWASRGFDWGFHFLRTAGLYDPLLEYDRAFSHFGDLAEGALRTGDTVALRFLDPMGRQDSAGRVIPHDFVIFGPVGEADLSFDELRVVAWAEVASEFDLIWDAAEPPRPGSAT